jgi:DNA-binding response OmpR family regulator
VIVLDASLSAPGDQSMLEHLRRETSLAQTPVIILATLILPGEREHYLTAGATAYVPRPVRLSELTALIDTQVRAARAGIETHSGG